MIATLKNVTMRLFLCLLVWAPGWAQDWATARLQKSPRHLEWVDLPQGDRQLKCFVAYPEVAQKAPAVLLIHEIFGLTDWVRSTADELAEAGFLVIAPDLLSGNGKGTSDLGGDDAARKAIASLNPDQITADLQCAGDYARQLPASSGQLSVVGFCWGGSQSFGFATQNPELRAALVFYGAGPSRPDDFADIQCPVYGFYAENDARIGQTLPQTTQWMQEAGKTFLAETYGGAGHAFMRLGQAPEATPANAQARQSAWRRMLTILRP